VFEAFPARAEGDLLGPAVHGCPLHLVPCSVSAVRWGG
jgi:hypothetical protein